MGPRIVHSTGRRMTSRAWRLVLCMCILGLTVVTITFAESRDGSSDPSAATGPRHHDRSVPHPTETDSTDRPTVHRPDKPPAQICGNTSVLDGPTTAPAGSVTVPAGDNSDQDLGQPNTTYWFAPGTHTLGSGKYSQIEPADDSTYVGAPNSVIDGQNVNAYAFTGSASDVTIRNLTIINFMAPRDQGVVNHDSGSGWTIESNTVKDNKGAGVFLGTDNELRHNCLKDNGQYGFQAYSNSESGPHNITIMGNEISGNNRDDWENKIDGCGCTGGAKLWHARHVTIVGNYVHHNLSVGIWADTNNNDFVIEGNYFSDNSGPAIEYETSYNAIIRRNTFVHNGLKAGPTNPGFPTGAVYVSESGGDPRLPARTKLIDIAHNVFRDNWSGVVLWENADRFCASPANTSTDACTLVDPKATLASCAKHSRIDEPPYYADCRWKTQNVKVHRNKFILHRSKIPKCTAHRGCGFQAIFSNFGTYPDWSPYKGESVMEAITYHQGNVFKHNTYVGAWKFKAFSQDSIVSFSKWRDDPINQDAHSTFMP